MLTDAEAKAALQAELPDIEVAAQATYGSLYLFRVVWPSAEEANHDPFFSVDMSTGEVAEFSIMTDGDPVEVAAAFANQEGGDPWE